MPNNTAGITYTPEAFANLGLVDPVSSKAFQEINRLITYGGDPSQISRDNTAYNRDLNSIDSTGDQALTNAKAEASMGRDINQLAGKRAIQDQATNAFETAAIPTAQRDKSLTYDKWLAENQRSQAKKARDISTAATVASIVAMIAIAAA